MFKIFGLVLFFLSLSFLAKAQDQQNEEQYVQSLIDMAAHINVTRPPQETLDYLDSIRDELTHATPRQLAQLYIIKARSHALSTEFAKALEILEDLLTSDLDPDLRLRTLELSANLGLHLDRFEKGFDHLNQAMVLQEAVDDPALKSGVFGLAAYWHTQLGDQEKGLEYGYRTLDLARETGDPREMCVALEKLAQAKEMLGLYEQALERYQDGLEICEKAEDPVFTGVMHSFMGRLLFRMGRHEEAESWLKQGIEMTAASGFEDGVTDTMAVYAEFLLAQQRYDEARELLHQVLERTRSGGRPQNHADAHRMLARISQHSGDYRSAWEHLHEYVQAREEVLDVERARLIAFQEVQLDLHTRDQEIQLLREQARVASLQETARKQQQLLVRVSYALATFVLLLLLILLMRTLRQRHHFRHMSAHDGLTLMLNHTHFIEKAKAQVDEAAGRGQSLTLLLADIDHFKMFNDRHGHQQGDEVLRQAAGCFKQVLSQHGVVGRIGGEEFAATLPGMDLNNAAGLVEQIREALRSCRLSDIDETVTMSFGIAQLQPSEAFDSLRARADSALYQAKHAGRDRTVMADSPLQ